MNEKDFTSKNCLLVFGNKRANRFETFDRCIKRFAEIGYCFTKISFIAYDSSSEIVRSIVESKDNYENVIVYGPKSMERTLKKFITSLYKSEFDELGVLKAEKLNVFFLYSDSENILTYDKLKRILDKKYGKKYDKTYIKFVGAPSLKIVAAIKQAKTVCGDVEYNLTESFGDCTLEIIYGNSTAKMIVDEIVRTVMSNLGEYVYALENVSLVERLFQLLKLRRMKICVAESFTGGGICKRLVELSGISQVFLEGLNTYSNESKISRLGVSEYTLKRYGAVSSETASEMAEGLLNANKCDIGISSTGIAGPNSDNTSKPVGLIYIGIATQNGVSVYKYNLKGGRKEITETAINLALFLAYKTIK